MSSLLIRTETESDHTAVFEVIQRAFASEAISDHDEQYLVERLRMSEGFLPNLSLVAEWREQVVGHIIFTPIKIVDGDHAYPSLALAPVSVLPDFQGRGIGGQLIEKGHELAREAGHTSVVLLGHAQYYPRFGYQPAHNFDIRLPFEVPLENCMAIELQPGSLNTVRGIVQYPRAFFPE